MGWYKVQMSMDEVAEGSGMLLQDEFARLFREAVAPRDMALFSGTSGGLGNYFLSPGAEPYTADLRATYGATECERPSGEMVLLVGHSDAWRLLRE